MKAFSPTPPFASGITRARPIHASLSRIPVEVGDDERDGVAVGAGATVGAPLELPSLLDSQPTCELHQGYGSTGGAFIGVVGFEV